MNIKKIFPEENKMNSCFPSWVKIDETKNHIGEDENFFYKIILKGTVNDEIYFLNLLKNKDIIPNIISIDDCLSDGELASVVIMEKYDGTLDDYLNSTSDITKIMSSLQRIIQKSLKLNFIYKVRHGDFHGYNIVYKKLSNSEIKWSFIDFGLSMHYDEQNKNIKNNNESEFSSKSNYSKYLPYYDLLFLENYFGNERYKLVLKGPLENQKQKYFLIDDNGINDNKIPLTFHVS